MTRVLAKGIMLKGGIGVLTLHCLGAAGMRSAEIAYEGQLDSISHGEVTAYMLYVGLSV